MRKVSLYILIVSILAVSFGHTLKMLRYRCYGLMNMLWHRENFSKVYIVKLNKTTYPFMSTDMMVLADRADVREFVRAFKRAFPGVYYHPSITMGTEWTWWFFTKGGIDMSRYEPDSQNIRNLFKMIHMSPNMADTVIDWTNKYWTNVLKKYIPS